MKTTMHCDACGKNFTSADNFKYCPYCNIPLKEVKAEDVEIIKEQMILKG